MVWKSVFWVFSDGNMQTQLSDAKCQKRKMRKLISIFPAGILRQFQNEAKINVQVYKRVKNAHRKSKLKQKFSSSLIDVCEKISSLYFVFQTVLFATVFGEIE